jgi:hypothetical protein
VELPNSFDRFREIWSGDFEFKSDACHRPVPVAFFAKERRTDAEIRMRREQLLTSARFPFDGPDTLFTSYSAVAELSCFRELGQTAPRNVLCSYAECCAAINGLDIDGLAKKRPKLWGACELYGLPHMSAADKTRMIDLIISKLETEWTGADWQEIERGNENDVLQEMSLLETLAPTIDLEAALFRGRYSKAVPAIEANGLPVDTRYLNVLIEHWPALRMGRLKN